MAFERVTLEQIRSKKQLTGVTHCQTCINKQNSHSGKVKFLAKD